MKTKLNLLILLVAALLVTSCNMLKYVAPQPEDRRFSLNSEPEGAKVFFNGELICNSTPGSAVVRTTANLIPSFKAETSILANPLKFTFVKSGYESQEVVLYPTITDYREGKFYGQRFNWPNGVFCELERKDVYEEDPTIVAGGAEERVSRDNPGATSLERTILRWYFDSDPRGARIFYRVISSVPSEVKNTNETYLTTTPYEETKSFNILGLTYENSRDVTIEIKVTKRGYEDQVKRFNVRQAIDQQEISGFFELVPKED